MSGRNEQTSASDASAPPGAASANGASATPPGGAPGPNVAADRRLPAEGDRPAQEAGAEPRGRSGVDRAEELASHMAQRVAALTSVATRKLVGLAYRAREVAQDFWADVQDFRNGKRP
jgi:hypothetical protein